MADLYPWIHIHVGSRLGCHSGLCEWWRTCGWNVCSCQGEISVSTYMYIQTRISYCSFYNIIIIMQSINPKIKMIASEPKNADDCARSFAAGKRLGNETPPDTICDALK